MSTMGYDAPADARGLATANATLSVTLISIFTLVSLYRFSNGYNQLFHNFMKKIYIIYTKNIL